ncbi:MAG: GumC family protein [Alphaproteobacteria bacterium]
MATITPLPVGPRELVHESAILAQPQPVVDPRQILGVLRRRKWLIAGIVLLVGGLATLFVNQITPIYSAEALLVVESSRENVLNIESVVQGLPQDYFTNETEAAVIASRELAVKAVERLNLRRHPLFDPDLAPPPPGMLDAVRETVRRWILGDDAEEIDVEATATALSPEEAERQLKEDLVSYYLAGLNVVPSTRARVISVSYASSDPEFAALAANTSAEIYIQDQITSKGAVTVRASEWLTDRVDELGKRLLESEKRLEEFRRGSGIIEVGGASVLSNQLTELNSKLIVARAQNAEAEARYAQVYDLLQSEGGVETAAAVLDAPLIQRLREQETQVVRKIAELATQVRETRPRMILARNELKDLQGKIASEVNKIVLNLYNELEIAQVRADNLTREIGKLERRLDSEKDAEVTLRALESEVRANTQLHDTLLARLNETRVQEDDLQPADARIISRATPIYVPFYPRKKLLILAAVFFGLVVAVAFAFILEYLDSGFRSLHQMEANAGAPALAMVPWLKEVRRKRLHPHQYLMSKPNSAYGESVRSLRTAIMLSQPEMPPRSVAILSSVPNEGKTSTTLSLATLAARSGQRVVVVDCDTRHPRVHRFLDMPNEVGLIDYLTGAAEFEDIVEIDPLSGIHLIAAGSKAPNPPDLFASERMRVLLERLHNLYDLVLIDTPPMLAVSDALVLVRQVDRVLFVVRWAKTRRETVLAGIKQVKEAGAHLAGLVLSQVDIRKHAQYEYRDSGYYYGSYSKYYIE